MEVARNYLPSETRLIDNIVYELKSQGIFDNFRKECIADVDTKPAYQNLRQRVEGSVTGFLRTQQWSPHMNKNQVREMLRKTISESGFLETGVERIVDQVVNPKINSIFFPQVETIVYKFLGIEKPVENSITRTISSVNTVNITVPIHELPKDLEAVSPGIGVSNERLAVAASNALEQLIDNKIEDEESPPFEAFEEKTGLFPPQEESSMESQLSGISELTSHDSNHSIGPTKTHEMDVKETSSKTTDMDVADGRNSSTTEANIDEDPQNSMDTNDNSRLSLQELEINEDKMQIDDDSSKAASDVTDRSSKLSFTNVLNQTVTNNSNSSNVEPISNTDSNKLKKSDSTHHSRDKHSSDKHKSSSTDHKNERYKKHNSHKSDSTHKSTHSSKDHDKKDRDSTRSDTKSDKDKKSEKYSSSRHSSSRHSRDRSSKNSISESGESKTDTKSKESSRHKNPSKKEDSNEVNNKKNIEKSKEKDKSDHKKYSSDSKHSKDKNSHSQTNSKSRSESNSHHSSRDRSDSKNHSKHKSDNVKKSEHRRDDKHCKSEKYLTSSNKDKRDKDKKVKKHDDHHISKDKKSNRRSTDRDSSDGRSGTHSSSSSFADLYSSSQLQKANDESSKINSGSNSGDSGNSDQIEANLNTGNNTTLTNFQQVKLIKPKFASNIFEARRLLKIRKKLKKLEKQNQAKLLTNNINVMLNESVKQNHVDYESSENQESISKKNVTSKIKTGGAIELQISKKEKPYETERSPSPLQTSVISKESWDAIEAKLNCANVLNVDYNSYGDISDDIDNLEHTLTCEDNDSVAEVKVTNSTDKNQRDHSSNSEETENDHKTNDVTVDSQRNNQVDNDQKIEVPNENKDDEVNKNCLYLVPEVLPETQRYFDKIAYRITLLEDEIARRTKLLVLHMENQKNRDPQFNIHKRLPKVDVVDVNSDSEIVILPSKSTNCQVENHQDIHNNNNKKRKMQFDDVDGVNENTNDQTASLQESEKLKNSTSKTKKIKLSNSVAEDFSLPLSPADSENSITSNTEQQKPNIRTSARRTSNSRQQSYTNEDLYKPRLRFASSRRRLDTNSSTDAKN